MYVETFSKRCTHLCIVEAKGDKFAAALRWNVPAVRADWLLECACQGRRVEDVAGFLPLGVTPQQMEGLRQQARQAAAAAAAGAPSQAGPSQMLSTQVGGGGRGVGAGWRRGGARTQLRRACVLRRWAALCAICTERVGWQAGRRHPRIMMGGHLTLRHVLHALPAACMPLPGRR